jgi:hypothetical protein
MASMALMILPAVAPAVARDYGIDASLIGYQIGIVGACLLFMVIAVLQRGRPRWDDDPVHSTPAIAKNPFAGFRSPAAPSAGHSSASRRIRW